MTSAPKLPPRRPWTAPRIKRLGADQAGSGLVAINPESLGMGS